MNTEITMTGADEKDLNLVLDETDLTVLLITALASSSFS
jgi:hypothetical protein